MQDLPQAPQPAAERRSSWGAIVVAVVFVLAIFAPLICFAISGYLYLPLDEKALSDASLRYSVPLLVLFVIWAVAAAVTRRHRDESSKNGHGRFHRLRDLGATCALGAVLLVGGGAALVQLINGAFDSSPARVHRARVHSHRELFRGYHLPMTRYLVVARSPRTRESLETLSVPRRVYGAVAAGALEVDVTTKAGYLGFEWVESVEVVAAEPAPPMSAPMSRLPSSGPGVAPKGDGAGTAKPGMECFQGFAPGEGSKPIYGPCR